MRKTLMVPSTIKMDNRLTDSNQPSPANEIRQKKAAYKLMSKSVMSLRNENRSLELKNNR